MSISLINILQELNIHYDGTDISAMNLSYDIAHKFSTCRLAHVGKGVGAIIVKNGKVISFGYNGVVDGIMPCTKDTCIRLTNNIPHGTLREICYGDCAEKRAIINALKLKQDVSGATIYITKSPCISCAKMIINLNIKEVVYVEPYANSEFAFELLNMAGIAYRALYGFCREDHYK